VFPVFVMEAVCELLVLPTRMLPKLKVLALGVSSRVCAVPLPLRAIVVGEFVALLTMEMLPDRAPAAVGENAADNVALCPAASVSGTAKLLAENPAPVTVT